MEEKKAKKKKLSAVQWIIIVLCVGVFAFSGWKIYGISASYKENEDTYNDIADAVLTDPGVAVVIDDSEEDDAWPLGEVAPPTEQVVELVPAVDFNALYKISKNAVAWLYCPDTVINYPVAKAKDNSYYVRRSLNGKYSNGGTLFVDYRNSKDFSDRNTIIYGHHLRNGKMFACLEQYRKQAYYDKHPVFYLTTPTGKYRLEAFSGYVTPAVSNAYRLSFSGNSDFESWLASVKKKSTFKSDVVVTATDKVVTLSTCAYDYDNARYVVHCKLVLCEGGIWY